LIAVLNDAGRLLVGQTEQAELATLDEDAAIGLETRIRQARNKYIGQYRRALRSPALANRRASTRAAGDRRQAKRDGR
jgi:hypothetical protein